MRMDPDPCKLIWLPALIDHRVKVVRDRSVVEFNRHRSADLIHEHKVFNEQWIAINADAKSAHLGVPHVT